MLKLVFRALCNGKWSHENHTLGGHAADVSIWMDHDKKIFTTLKKYLQAKDIAANLSHCDADIVAACSWIQDEYEPTIEVRQISKVRINVRIILRPA